MGNLEFIISQEEKNMQTIGPFVKSVGTDRYPCAPRGGLHWEGNDGTPFEMGSITLIVSVNYDFTE